MPGIQSYVFSHTLRPEECPDAIVSDDPQAIIQDLKSKEGKDIWLFGGGSLFHSLLEQGLVDSVEVAIMPVLLGGGVSLLPPPADLARLTLIRHQVYEKTGTVVLEYAVS